MTERRSYKTKPPIQLDIDDEEFLVIAAVPAEEFAALLDLQAGLTGEGIGLNEQYAGIKEILRATMLAESWERFEGRLSDRSRPIDFQLLLQITQDLASEWGKGSTPSASSSTEPPETTETSTPGSPPEDSVLTESPSVEISVVPDTSDSSTTGEPGI